MVALTNSTTSSTSVTDVAVSSANQTNISPSSFGNRIFGDSDTASKTSLLQVFNRVVFVKATLTQYALASSISVYGSQYDDGQPVNITAAIYSENFQKISETETLYLDTLSSEETYTLNFSQEVYLQPGIYYLGVVADEYSFAIYRGFLQGSDNFFRSTNNGYSDFPDSFDSLFKDSLVSAAVWCSYSAVSPEVTDAVFPSLSTGNTSSVIDSTSSLRNVIYGIDINNFEGGIITGLFAKVRIPTLVSVSGYTKMAVYIDGQYLFETDSIYFNQLGTEKNFTTSYEFANQFVPGGRLSLVVMSSSNLDIQLNGESGTGVYTQNTFTSGFPALISTSNLASLPNIYATYQPVEIDQIYGNTSTWRQFTSPWSSATGAWDSYTDITSITNV